MMMDKSEIENKLKLNGFSDKDIKFIKKWSEREGDPAAKTIRQLYRVFLGMSVLLFLLTSIAVYEYFCSDDFISYLIAYIVAVTLLFLFAPMWLGAKVFLMLKKHGVNYLL